MSEQTLKTALSQVCTQIRDDEIENLKSASLLDRQTVELDRRQIYELSERIGSLPQLFRDVLLARYSYKMSAEAIENLYGVDDARGKCLYAEKLLGYALNLKSNEALLPENLTEACNTADNRLTDKIVRDMENHQLVLPTRKHERKMRDIFRRDGKRSKLFVAMRTAAMFALALLLSGTIAISVNAELRGQFFDWLVDAFPKFSYFRVEADPAATETSYETLLLYKPTYIPDGFIESPMESSPLTVSYSYANSEGYQLFVTGRLPDVSQIGLNTEGAEIETLTFRGEKAYYWEQETSGAYFTFILDGYHFFVYGPVDRSEIFKIAENIKIP